MKLFPQSKRPSIVSGIRASTSWILCRSRPRTLDQARNIRPDTPPAARHGESWNVMPAV